MMLKKMQMVINDKTTLFREDSFDYFPFNNIKIVISIKRKNVIWLVGRKMIETDDVLQLDQKEKIETAPKIHHFYL